MTTERGMSVAETRAVMNAYFEANHSDVSMIADDCVFRVMATGDESRGPEAIVGMINYFYSVAFEAEAERRNFIVGEGSAFLEADFVGTHTGDFAGVPATGRSVRVPLAVAYDLRDGKIVEGRVYFEIPAFLAQVGALG
jgi:steroid delta-isomerase-like uncharacterized protein